MFNTLGEDISGMVASAAQAADVDPVHLLALIKAESNLNPRATRWGEWPDISFGYGQQIVMYHYYGDRSDSIWNIQMVMRRVFENPQENLDDAARRLARCFRHSTCDGSPLSAMCIYNAGSDRRGEPWWMLMWDGNVRNYQDALEWAEGYRA